MSLAELTWLLNECGPVTGQRSSAGGMGEARGGTGYVFSDPMPDDMEKDRERFAVASRAMGRLSNWQQVLLIKTYTFEDRAQYKVPGLGSMTYAVSQLGVVRTRIQLSGRSLANTVSDARRMPGVVEKWEMRARDMVADALYAFGTAWVKAHQDAKDLVYARESGRLDRLMGVA